MRSIKLAIIIFCMALLTFRWIQRRGTWHKDLGLWPHPHKVLDFFIGTGIGTLAMLLIFGIEWAFGWLHPGPFVKAGLMNLGILPPMVLMALWEELQFRSIQISGFRTLMPPWAALTLSSMLFGLAHAWNANATTLSILGNIVGGIVYGYAFLASGSIWLPTGLHAAWNIVQGPILGLPISGYLEGGLWHPAVSGPQLFTGAAYGPEGGLVGLSSHILILALLCAYLKMKQQESLDPPAESSRPSCITCLIR